MNMLNHLLPMALGLLALATPSTCVSVPAHNRTFTLTAFNTTNPYINGKPILIAPKSGIASVVVNLPSGSDAEPLKAFIYNRNIYRPCKTSPTGNCLGMLSKAYAGALTGWYFDFSDDETPKQLGPTPPTTGGFGLLSDWEYPPTPTTPTKGTPCSTPKPRKVTVLGQGVSEDGKQGLSTWAACDLGQPGTGTTNGYGFNSIPVPSFAHNGPQCSQNYGIKFKISYTH